MRKRTMSVCTENRTRGLIVDTPNKQYSSVHIYTCASRSIHIWRGGAKRKSCQIKKLPENEVAA